MSQASDGGRRYITLIGQSAKGKAIARVDLSSNLRMNCRFGCLKHGSGACRDAIPATVVLVGCFQ
ncbi:MAG: hypothetical protein ACPHAS_09695 [Synechococcus sp.]